MKILISGTTRSIPKDMSLEQYISLFFQEENEMKLLKKKGNKME